MFKRLNARIPSTKWVKLLKDNPWGCPWLPTGILKCQVSRISHFKMCLAVKILLWQFGSVLTLFLEFGIKIFSLAVTLDSRQLPANGTSQRHNCTTNYLNIIWISMQVEVKRHWDILGTVLGIEIRTEDKSSGLSGVVKMTTEGM